jgi:hypothetical protein
MLKKSNILFVCDVCLASKCTMVNDVINLRSWLDELEAIVSKHNADLLNLTKNNIKVKKDNPPQKQPTAKPNVNNSGGMPTLTPPEQPTKTDYAFVAGKNKTIHLVTWVMPPSSLLFIARSDTQRPSLSFEPVLTRRLTMWYPVLVHPPP